MSGAQYADSFFFAVQNRWISCVPSSETQGQSVGSGEKAGQKFSSTGKRAPGYWPSPSYFQNFKRMPAPDWARKMLCIILPNRRTVSPELFSWVHTRRLLFLSRIVWLMHQRSPRSQETFSLILNPHLISKYCLLEKWRHFSKNTSLSLQQVFTLASVTSCINIREFLKGTMMADNYKNIA